MALTENTRSNDSSEKGKQWAVAQTKHALPGSGARDSMPSETSTPRPVLPERRCTD